MTENDGARQRDRIICCSSMQLSCALVIARAVASDKDTHDCLRKGSIERKRSLIKEMMTNSTNNQQGKERQSWSAPRTTKNHIADGKRNRAASRIIGFSPMALHGPDNAGSICAPAKCGLRRFNLVERGSNSARQYGWEPKLSHTRTCYFVSDS